MRIRQAIDRALLDLRTMRWLTRVLWRPTLSQLRSERRRPRRAFGR